MVQVNNTYRVQFTLAASVALITVLVYLPALRNGFVYWDDNLYIFENSHVRALDAAFFRWAFLDFQISNWHPLTWISHAVDYAIWGLNPLGHHLTNIILHGLNTFLVVLLVMRLLETVHDSPSELHGSQITTHDSRFTNHASRFTVYDPPFTLIAAAATGLLFGIHPVHVESVAWVSERKDLLCALFFLLSIMAYTKAVRRMGHGAESKKLPLSALLSALCFFILALMSKPMAVTLPAVLLILDWHPLGRIRSARTLWLAGVEKIPFFALSLASAIITILAQRTGESITAMDIAPLEVRLLVAVKALAGYLGQIVMPLHLLPLYPYPKVLSPFSMEYVLPSLFVIIITIACFMSAKRQKGWLAVWGYYVATLLPVIGIVQIGSQAMADRYNYLPSLGPFLIAGVSVAWASARAQEKKWLNAQVFSLAVVILVSLPLSYLTVQQIRIWRDSISLWNHELEREPGVRQALVNRGMAFLDSGQFGKAIDDFTGALTLSSSDYLARYNRGLALSKLNLVQQAIADYSAAIAAKPSYVDAYNNRGILYEKTGRIDNALADYNAAISQNPSYVEAYINRAVIYYNKGQVDGALADLGRAIILNPANPDAYYNRAWIYSRTGRLDSALADFDTVLTIMPTYYDAYYERALVFQKIGQTDKADRDFLIWKEHSARQ